MTIKTIQKLTGVKIGSMSIPNRAFIQFIKQVAEVCPTCSQKREFKKCSYEKRCYYTLQQEQRRISIPDTLEIIIKFTHIENTAIDDSKHPSKIRIICEQNSYKYVVNNEEMSLSSLKTLVGKDVDAIIAACKATSEWEQSPTLTKGTKND